MRDRLVSYLRGEAPTRANPTPPPAAFRSLSEARKFFLDLLSEATKAAAKPIPRWVKALCLEQPDPDGEILLETAISRDLWSRPVGLPMRFLYFSHDESKLAPSERVSRAHAAMLLSFGPSLGAAMAYAAEAATRFGLRHEGVLWITDHVERAMDEMGSLELQGWLSMQISRRSGFSPYGSPSVAATAVFDGEIMPWSRNGTTKAELIWRAAKDVGLDPEVFEWLVDFWNIWQRRGERGERMLVHSLGGVPSYEIPSMPERDEADDDPSGDEPSEDSLEGVDGLLGLEAGEMAGLLDEVERDMRAEREESTSQEVPIDPRRNPYAPVIELARIGVQLLCWVGHEAVLYVPSKNRLKSA